MCNFYIMYYSNSSSKEPGGECYTNQLPLLASMLPADSDVPLPPNPLLDEEAHGHHHHAGMTMTTPAARPTLSTISAGKICVVHSSKHIIMNPGLHKILCDADINW